MRIDEIEVDYDAIEGGTWRDAVGLPGVRFKLRGAANTDWRRLNAKIVSEMPKDKQFSLTVDPEDEDAITCRLLLEACVQDWSGLEDNDGDAIEFSPDMAKILLTEPRYRRFQNSALATARILQTETVAEREAAAKN